MLGRNLAQRVKLPRVRRGYPGTPLNLKTRAGWPAGSDLKPHLNDRLGNPPQAGVVVAGVRAYELVGLLV